MNGVVSTSLELAGLASPVVLALLGMLVSLRLLDRTRTQQGLLLRVWMLGAGLSLAATLWGTHFAALQAPGSPAPSAGLDGAALLGSLGTAMLGSTAALLVAHAFRRRVAGIAAGALLLAAGALGSHRLGLLALGMQPWPSGGLGALVGTGLAMLALSATAFLLCFRPRTLPRLTGLPRQWLAAALLAGGPLLLLLGLPPALAPEDGSWPGAAGLALAQEMPRVLTLGSLGLMLTLLLIASLFDAQGEARLRRLKRSLHQARLRLTYTTRHDLLTRLLNRPAFEEHLQRAVDAASLQQTQPVVLLIEIDDFRTYNSAWGAAAGDQMLQQVAGRLKEMARPEDVVARIGWEQFALLMKQVESPREMSRTATRIVRALARPLKMPHGPTHLSCSIGLATSRTGQAPREMLAQAHAAMIEARYAGGNTFRFFESQMGAQPPEQLLSLQQELRRALERDEFELYYQPVVNARDLRPCAAEALIRWRHPTRGLLSPAVFLPAAEQLELSMAIGQWVLERAAAQVATWAAMGLHLRISVNAFPSQVRMPGVAAQLAEVHRRFDISPGSLALDVQEPALMSETEAAESLFAALRQIGMPGSVDDFGSNCSLQQLRLLRPREVKLDRALVSKLESDVEARAMVEAVIRLAHALDIRVVAKGVETQRQQDLLTSLQCDELQGLRFAGALPAAELTSYLQRQPPQDGNAVCRLEALRPEMA